MSQQVEYGISITPMWPDQPVTIGLAEVAEEAGLDLIGIQDHPYQWRFYDTWTLIAYLSGRTSRIRFFPDVAVLPLRPPAILAKSAASLDLLTGGRVELGLGAGGFWDAIAAMGGPRRTPSEAVEATEEAIDIMRLIWSGERGVRYEGAHYQLAGVHTGPAPAHEIGIWVGASRPRMLDLIGRKADGWVPSASWASPADLPGYLDRIQQAAVGAGRDPKALRCIYNVSGAVESSHSGDFSGPVSYWVEELSRIAEFGVDAFIFWPGNNDPLGQARLFGEEIVPPCAQVGVDSTEVGGRLIFGTPKTVFGPDAFQTSEIGKELAEDALATLLDNQAASLGKLQPSEQIDLANLLRPLLIALGDTPAFRPAIVVQRGQS